MKIKANVFHDFVKKTSFDGLIPGSVYKVTEKGLENFNKTTDTMALVHGILSPTAIKEQNGFSLSIGSNERLMKCLKEFGEEEIDILPNHDKGRAFLVGKSLQVECVMTSENMIDSTLEEVPPTLKFEMEPFKVGSDVFKKAAGYAKILGQNSLKLQAANGDLMVVSGEDNFDQFTQRYKVSAPDFSAEFGEVLHSIVSVFDGEIKCWAGTNYPIKFEEQTANYLLTVIAAPIVNK